MESTINFRGRTFVKLAPNWFAREVAGPGKAAGRWRLYYARMTDNTPLAVHAFQQDGTYIDGDDLDELRDFVHSRTAE